MIGFLSGNVKAVNENKVLVWCGPSGGSGVGYLVTIPTRGEYLKFSPGNTAPAAIELWIYTHVREDALDLYGFLTSLEKELFLALLSVTGIGPKAAMNLLSGLSPSELMYFIQERNEKKLSSISGIGKKTAERIILELADSLEKKLTHVFVEGSTRRQEAEISPPSPKGVGPIASTSGQEFFVAGVLEDAISALQALGYRDQEVRGSLRGFFSEHWSGENRDQTPTVEILVKRFLKERAVL